MSDKIILFVALALVAAAIGGFYYFEDQTTLVRVAGLLGVFTLAAVLATRAEQGKAAVGYLRAAQLEVRKVVWPTRNETLQTTLLVMVMVLVAGLFLWLVDMFLMWVVRLLTGQGG